MSSITTTLQAMGSNQAPDEAPLTARGGWLRELGDLTLNPMAATADVEWVGTLTGLTPGSTVEAVSDDDTELTVDGDTITGTFADAGSPVVTVTETLAGASDTPSVTTFEITVSA